MIELKVINQHDPLERKVEKQHEQEEFSPMDPPDAYSPPNLEAVPYKEMHPFLRQLIDEHQVCIKELDAFEQALLQIQNEGLSREADKKLRDFFHFFDNNIVKHNQKEEATLFPLLHRRLIENGEHGRGHDALTAVDMLEDDHVKALQLAAVVFNFFGLAMRLPDVSSRLVVLDAALEQGKSLVELLKLHIFREDNIAFAQAQRLLTKTEFDEMEIRALPRN
ncbi:MAG: hemerythrin domain-containing protein [Bacteroidetes bacterium]|nr:hemerythrin domain-containing protein [Bacteroidota bacterium]